MIQEQINKLQLGDRPTLAKLITLAESGKESDQQLVHELLEKTISLTGKSVRLGITGAPGVGKSTFIENFGSLITSFNKKVAVLTVDPSSPISKGSILGDKTRMENLSKDPLAFIRPTASKSFLGGVSHATREAILLCEIAGYEVVIVETVGVGQSEFSVKDMTDCFLLLMLAGAGDELQGIKKGIMEMADVIMITKADGNNIAMANRARSEYEHALHLLRHGNGWTPSVLTCSAIEKTGLEAGWNMITSFINYQQANNQFHEVRKTQKRQWLNDQLTTQLKKQLFNNNLYNERWKEVEEKIDRNEWTVFRAVSYLLQK